MKKTAADKKRDELIAKSVRTAVEKNLPPPPPEPVFEKLSSIPGGKRYVKCFRCRHIFENDVNTSHAPCPECGAVMENISFEAAKNLKEQWDRESEKKNSGR